MDQAPTRMEFLMMCTYLHLICSVTPYAPTGCSQKPKKKSLPCPSRPNEVPSLCGSLGLGECSVRVCCFSP